MNQDDVIRHLLGHRPTVWIPDQKIRGCTFLVTGAGGTIGSELVRALYLGGARRVVMLEKDEYALYLMSQEMPESAIPALGDYGDAGTVRRLLDAYKPDCVIHAGAYKHVPLVERNPIAGVTNNVLKFKTLLRVLEECHQGDLVVVSTDKAVRPTNVMGATKRLVELLALNCTVPTSIVRFGNVLGSSGSVLPLWMSQYHSGQALTVTDAEVTRYFMSVQEAVSLILNARTLKGVCVLDMGEPVKILDMAKRFLELQGEKSECIEITGLRPGEKLHEELYVDQCLEPTIIDRVLRDLSAMPAPWMFRERLTQLANACQDGDAENVRYVLAQLVEGYKPACAVQDDVHLAMIDDCYRTPSPEVFL